MEVRRAGAPAWRAHPRFSGEVAHQPLGADGDRPEVMMVACAVGSVTDFHQHPGGQVLVVVDGSVVETAAGDEARLTCGDTAVAPPEERHRHGAAQGAAATFVAVTWDGTTWEE